jgi:predicted Zn-dependent protease
MEARKVMAIFLIILLVGLPATSLANNKADNPNDIGKRKVAQRSLISLQKEIAIGQRYAAQIDRTAHLLKDPVVTEYVNRVEQNIARNSDAKIPITVHIIEDPTINAMTLPGGFIYVNTGLIKTMNKEDELAGVLAHETAHVAIRSWASEMTKQTILQYAMIPLMFTPMSYALYYGVMEAYMNGVPMAFLKFSRDQEKKADFFGIQYLWKAGYDPNGFVEAFGKIIQQYRSVPGSVPSIFMDHPPTGDRIVKAEEEIKELLPKRHRYLVTTSGYVKMRERLAMDMGAMNNLTREKNAPTLRRRNKKGQTGKGRSQGNEKPPVLERRN